MHRALWECDFDESGFRWVDADNAKQSVFSFIRYAKDKSETLLFVCNFQPVLHEVFELGVPDAGEYQELFNSDLVKFGGLSRAMLDKIGTIPEWRHNCDQYIKFKLPPLSAIVLKLYG